MRRKNKYTKDISMKTALFFAVIATLFSTYTLSLEFEDLPTTTGNELICVVIVRPADEGNTFLYSVIMHKDAEQKIASSFVGYEETMDFMKTVRNSNAGE